MHICKYWKFVGLLQAQVLTGSIHPLSAGLLLLLGNFSMYHRAHAIGCSINASTGTSEAEREYKAVDASPHSPV